MKTHEGLPWLRTGASRLCARTLACALAALVISPALIEAKEAVRNLGGGLEQIAAPASRAQGDGAAQKPAASEEPELN